VKQINYNGKLFSSDSPIFYLNRAIIYGDGLFESIRVHHGEILFLKDHIDRMLRGMKALKMEVSGNFTETFFHKQVVDLLREEKISGNARIRIGVFRGGGGLYEPRENSAEYFIEVIPLERGYDWSGSSCSIGVFRDIHKNLSSISFFKSMNELPNVLAAIFKKENDLDDCLLLNSQGSIADAISSNIFWIEDDKIFSPPVADGGVEGVMRKNLIRLMTNQKISVSEKSISPDEIKSAGEIFLTNVGWGIKPVTRFEEKTFQTKITKEIFQQLLLELA